jgi:hypothetical protein
LVQQQFFNAAFPSIAESAPYIPGVRLNSDARTCLLDCFERGDLISQPADSFLRGHSVPRQPGSRDAKLITIARQETRGECQTRRVALFAEVEKKNDVLAQNDDLSLGCFGNAAVLSLEPLRMLACIKEARRIFKVGYRWREMVAPTIHNHSRRASQLNPSPEC